MDKCVRCGYCCIAGCCSRGEESENTGVCKNLIIHDDSTTSCSLVLCGSSEGITVGRGCVLQGAIEAYAYCRKEYEPLKLKIRQFHCNQTDKR